MTRRRVPLRFRLLDWCDRLADRWGVVWECRVRGRHQAKFGTYPWCYRCGRRVSRH